MSCWLAFVLTPPLSAVQLTAGHLLMGTQRLVAAISPFVLDLVRPEMPPATHNDGSSFATVLTAVPAHVATARHRLARWLSDVAVVPSRVHDITLAVSEAVTNAIEHGSGCDASKLVSVQASVHNQALTATVSDSGRWIDSPPRPDSPTQRGRGLILIDGLTNSVDIARTATGTQITMQFDI